MTDPIDLRGNPARILAAIAAAQGEPLPDDFVERMAAFCDEPVQVVWIIEELWTDSLENHPAAASGWKVVGVALTQEDSDSIVEQAGMVEGTGWPMRRGESAPRRKATIVEVLRPNTVLSRPARATPD